MRHTFYRWALTLALAWGSMAAHAQAVLATDVRAVREVVQAQLKALAADDAVRAFSYASPTIRTQFGDAATFMAMIKSGYPMVLRPAATAFFQPEATDSTLLQVVQVVQLRGRDGRAWLATYALQRQPDGRWRINGCTVQPDTGKSST